MPRAARVAVVAALLLGVVACRPEIVVRLATRVFADGAVERRIEVAGRPSDPNEEVADDFLAEKAGVVLARPEAWARVERGPGRLYASGHFASAELLPPLLGLETSVGEREDRTRTTIAHERRVVLDRWLFNEIHGDPFDPADASRALDALAGLAAEALRGEVRRELGDSIDTGRAEEFVKREARGLAAALLSASRRTSLSIDPGPRIALWSSILNQSGIQAVKTEADEKAFWAANTPLLALWSRARVAQALSTPDRPVAPQELAFWPAGEAIEEELGGVIDRQLGGTDALMERLEPLLPALTGYYGDQGAPRFRFEVRLQLPGTLLATNGTPDGDEIAWLFREEDLGAGEVALRAESVEPVEAALRTLGARRDLDRARLLQLADILWRRDPEGALVELLQKAVEAGRLAPLRDTESIPEPLRPAAAELADLLDPEVPLPAPI